MITAIIIEDVSIVRKNIKHLLNRFSDQITVVAEADSVLESEQLIKLHQPSVLFLDIKLKDGSCFDLLKKIDAKKHKIIFITAYNEYAVNAFKFSAIDYLLKPINEEEFALTIQKLKEVIHKDEFELKYNLLFNQLNFPEKKTKTINLKTKDGISSIELKDIVRCESENNYTWFHILGNKKILVSTTLKDYEELFSDYGFFRIHQSHLINLYHFDSLLKTDSVFVKMKDGSQLPLALRKQKAFEKIIESR